MDSIVNKDLTPFSSGLFINKYFLTFNELDSRAKKIELK